MSCTNSVEAGKLALCEAISPFIIDQLSISPYIDSQNNFFLAASSYNGADTQLLDVYQFSPYDGTFSSVIRYPTPYPLSKIIWGPNELNKNLIFMTISDSVRLYNTSNLISTFNHPFFNDDSKKLQSINIVACPFLGADWSFFNSKQIVTSSLDGKIYCWDLGSANTNFKEIVSAVSSFLSPHLISNYNTRSQNSTNFLKENSNKSEYIMNSGAMPICDVKFGHSDNIISYVLGNGDLYLADMRETPSRKVIKSPPQLNLSTISWLQLTSSQYLLQCDIQNSELFIHDIRRLNTSKASTQRIKLETKQNYSLISSHLNPIKPSTLLTAYEEGFVEIWDIPKFLGRPPQVDSDVALISLYNVNNTTNRTKNNLSTEVKRIFSFDISSCAYKGITNNSIQIAALSLCPDYSVSVPSDIHKKVSNQIVDNNTLPLLPSNDLANFNFPMLQIFRID